MPGELLGRDGVIRGDALIDDAVAQTTKPAIIIGIGGTGKEVLLRLRQRFFEKYGEAGLPTMAYLWLDTDLGNHGIINGKPIDYIQPEALFQTGESVDCQIPQAPFQQYFQNPNRYPHIWEWLYPQLAASGQVVGGANQIPPLGRLAFFHNFSAIKNALVNHSNKVFGQGPRQKLQDNPYGMDLDINNLLVIIVSSIAGGTGTGMLLDTAFLARHLFADRNPDIVGYLLLPTVFGSADKEPRMFANAYAKLKELEFYSLRPEFLLADNFVGQSTHDFKVDWTGVGYPSRPIPGPPFNNCYFIDNQTQLGGRIGSQDRTDICDMIAESIFVDFSAHHFAARKRMVRVNLNEFLRAVVDYEYKDPTSRVIHTDLFSCRYSTFGFSMVHVPLDRIRKACGYELACDIVRYWRRNNAVSGSLRSDIERDTLTRLHLRDYAGQDDYLKALSPCDDAGTTFQQFIKNEWAATRHKLQAQAQAGTGGLGAAFLRAFTDFQDAYFDESVFDAEPRGEFIRRLRKTNVKVFMDGRKLPDGASQSGATERIRQLLAEWLEREVVGINAAIEHLVVLDEILQDQIKAFQGLADRDNEIERARRDIESLRQIIADEEAARLGKPSLKAACDVICQRAEKYFNERILALIYDEARQLAEDLREYIGNRIVAEKDTAAKETTSGLIGDLRRLDEELGEMLAHFEKRRNSFDHADPHLIFQTLYKPGMFSEYYKLPDDGGNKIKPVPREMKAKLYAETGWGSLLSVQKEMKTGPTKATNVVENFSLARFRGHRLDVDVVEKLNQYYPDQNQRAKILENLCKSGTVWLRPSHKAQADPILAPYVDDVVTGLANQAHDSYNEVKDTLMAELGGAGFRREIGAPIDVNKHVIYLYSEYAGLPVPYVHGLEDYRHAYFQETRSNNHFPHINRINVMFSDIMVRDEDDIAKLIKANEILFMGAILKVFTLASAADGEEVQYSCPDRTGMHLRGLGNRHMALNALLSDKALLEQLEARVDQARAKLNLKTRQQLYTILRYHVSQKGTLDGIPDGPYPPKYVNAGAIKRENFSPEHRAITAIIEEERPKLTDQMRLKGEEADEKLKELFMDLYNDLDDFSTIMKIDGTDHRIFRVI